MNDANRAVSVTRLKMSTKSNNSIATKILLPVIACIIAYFSVVSTISITKVNAIEGKVDGNRKNINENEKNIAVIMEKIKNIEKLVTEIHSEVKR